MTYHIHNIIDNVTKNHYNTIQFGKTKVNKD